MNDARLSLEAAAELTRTGDLWLFRGRSTADHAIRAITNAPVNHVGMAVVLDDLPPLMWHAELGRGLPDAWTGDHHRGAQLHDLCSAVEQWSHRYDQQTWLRQLDSPVTREMEDSLLQTIARTNGIPFPTTAALANHWLRGRLGRQASVESTYCAEVVADTYQSMGLLAGNRPTNYYDPGKFWSGDGLQLVGDARLGNEIQVDVPNPALDAALTTEALTTEGRTTQGRTTEGLTTERLSAARHHCRTVGRSPQAPALAWLRRSRGRA